MIPVRLRVPVENENNHHNEAVRRSPIAGSEVNRSERKRKGLVAEVDHERGLKNLQTTHPKVDGNEYMYKY